MILRINLKTGSYIEIEDFSELNYRSSTGLVAKKNDELSSLSIYNDTTYHFKGKQEVVLRGAEIHYLELW